MPVVDKSRQPKKAVEDTKPVSGEVDEKATMKKPTRVPLSRYRDILSVMGKDPNYFYRWVKDSHENGSRLLEMKRAGYEHVRPSEVTVGEDKVDRESTVGDIVRLNYKGETLFLMKQPMEYREEDIGANRQELREIEQQILNPTIDPYDPTHSGQYGEIRVERN